MLKLWFFPKPFLQVLKLGHDTGSPEHQLKQMITLFAYLICLEVRGEIIRTVLCCIVY